MCVVQLSQSKALGQECSRQGEQVPDQAGWGVCIWILILSLLGEKSMNLKSISAGAAFGLSGQQQWLEVDARSPGSAVCAQARP